VPTNKNIKIISKYFLAPALFLFLSYSIYRQLLQLQHWQQSLRQLGKVMEGSRQWKLWMVLLLMPVNWGLETRKWQLSIRSLQAISFWKAYKAILTGTTMASFTPNRVGEYAGRILYIEEGKRISAISLTVVCSMAQLLVTLWTGCAGVFYSKAFYLHQMSWETDAGEAWLNLLMWSAAFGATVLSVVYFRLSRLVKMFGKLSFSSRWMGYVKVLADFPANILLRILFLSFALI
jgi:hypothetical protein